MRGRPGPHLLVLLACLLTALLALVITTPGAPAPASDAGFSALRVRDTIAALVGDGAPHPIGSAANDAVRERLIAHLRGLGLEPEVQRAFTCNEGICGPVTNLLVTVPGTSDAPAIALSAHYDSVTAGPGVADDLHGVALVAELLRLRLSEGPAHRPLVGLFTDGEEVGLLGATALLEHPRFSMIAVAINAEARGSGGRPLMFETSPQNRRLIAAVAAADRLPGANSLTYEVYRRMPNDTDLTVLRRGGAQGINYAFLGGVRRYHTPRDDLAHLDLASVQLQGDAIKAAAWSLLEDPEALTSSSDSTYIDLLGLVLLRWPAPLGGALAGLALALVAFAGFRGLRGDLRGRALAAGVGVVLLAPLLGAAGAHGVLWLIGKVSAPLGPFPAAAGLALVCACAAASAAVILALRPLARRLGAAVLALAAGLVWSAAALATALTVPGVSAILIPPALLAALGLAYAGGRDPRAHLVAAAPAALLAFALLAPLIAAVGDALGLLGLVIGGALGLLWSVALPALAAPRGERGVTFVGLGFAGVAVIGALLLIVGPRASADEPAHVNLLHVVDLDRGEARLVLDGLATPPPELADAAPWGEPVVALPWSVRARPATAPVAESDDAGPTLEITAHEPLEGDRRRLQGTLRARPGAFLAHIILPADVAGVRVGDHELDAGAIRSGPKGSKIVTLYAPPLEGVPLSLELGADALTLVDATPGLPPAVQAVADARGPALVASQWGDLSVAYRTLTP